MKRIATLALLFAVAIQASAVTLKWDAKSIAFNGTKLTKSSDVTGYLIYLQNGAYSTSPYTLTDSFGASSIGTGVNSADSTSSVAKMTGSWTFTAGETYNNGDKFGVLLVYTGAADGKTYYNLSSDVLTLSGAVEADISTQTPASDPSDMSFSFSYATSSVKGKLSAGGGWTAVPEPSTAMLALAGLALLIKRRRA